MERTKVEVTHETAFAWASAAEVYPTAFPVSHREDLAVDCEGLGVGSD